MIFACKDRNAAKRFGKKWWSLRRGKRAFLKRVFSLPQVTTFVGNRAFCISAVYILLEKCAIYFFTQVYKVALDNIFFYAKLFVALHSQGFRE